MVPLQRKLMADLVCEVHTYDPNGGTGGVTVGEQVAAVMERDVLTEVAQTLTNRAVDWEITGRGAHPTGTNVKRIRQIKNKILILRLSQSGRCPHLPLAVPLTTLPNASLMLTIFYNHVHEPCTTACV